MYPVACETWGAGGECSKNPIWMNAHCERTCAQCKGELIRNLSSQPRILSVLLKPEFLINSWWKSNAMNFFIFCLQTFQKKINTKRYAATFSYLSMQDQLKRLPHPLLVQLSHPSLLSLPHNQPETAKTFILNTVPTTRKGECAPLMSTTWPVSALLPADSVVGKTIITNVTKKGRIRNRKSGHFYASTV